MGRDKALLPFRGRPLVESIAKVVARAAGTVTLVGNPALSESVDFPVIPDVFPGQGPLGGILTALRHSEAEWNLIVACDMPELTAPFLTDLLDAATRSEAAVVMPSIREGLPEPLCAVYRRSAREPMEAAFAAGERKITAALACLRIDSIPVPDLKQFQNVNTPEDWAIYAGG